MGTREWDRDVGEVAMVGREATGLATGASTPLSLPTEEKMTKNILLFPASETGRPTSLGRIKMASAS